MLIQFDADVWWWCLRPLAIFCPLLFARMKAAVVCVFIAHVVMTSSQPTYDFEQLQGDCDCQRLDEKLEITVNSMKNQFAAMNSGFAAVKNELQQLRQQTQPTPETSGTSGPGVTSRPGVTYGPPIRHTGES